MFTKLGMPSFVVTLAGLIGWQGLLLYLLGKEGTINLPFDGAIAKLSDTWLPPRAGLGAGRRARRRVRGVGAGHPAGAHRRRARRVPAPDLDGRTGRRWLAVVLCVTVVVLDGDRGVPLTLVIFGALVVALDLVLRHTVGGRWMYAVGGNAEAARRAGINVTRDPDHRVRGGAPRLAAAGGILAAAPARRGEPELRRQRHPAQRDRRRRDRRHQPVRRARARRTRRCSASW